MRKRLRLTMVFVGAVAALAMTVGVASAQASFYRQTLSGTPGAFNGVGYVPVIEGGICNDISVPFLTCAIPSGHPRDYYDQIFINGYKAYTNASPVTQTISSTAYLAYYSSTNGWVPYREKNMGACPNKPGSGAFSCVFGHPAEDHVALSTCQNGGNCTPAFNNLSPGFSYRVYVRVVWRNYATGAILGSANYLPQNTSTDVGCAYYAQVTRGRCSPGVYQGVSYLYLH